MPKPLRLPNLAEPHVLDHLQVRLIQPHEKDPWNQLVVAHHSLKNANLVGAQLRSVAQYECRWLLLLGWSAAAFHLQAREQWLRWSQPQLRARRHFVAQNSRLVLLADRHQFPNLASRALALCTRRLSDDWQAAYGHPIVVVESFVDRQLFHGTASKAAGWTLLGPTAGFGRHAEDFYVRHDRPKQLWVRPLDPASGRYAVPGASTFFRALKAMDDLALERVVVQWQHDVLGPQDPNELIVLDGKAVANAQGQNLVTAVSVPSGRVQGLEPVRPKDPAPATEPPGEAAPAASAEPAPSSAEPGAAVPPPSRRNLRSPRLPRRAPRPPRPPRKRKTRFRPRAACWPACPWPDDSSASTPSTRSTPRPARLSWATGPTIC